MSTPIYYTNNDQEGKKENYKGFPENFNQALVESIPDEVIRVNQKEVNVSKTKYKAPKKENPITSKLEFAPVARNLQTGSIYTMFICGFTSVVMTPSDGVWFSYIPGGYCILLSFILYIWCFLSEFNKQDKITVEDILNPKQWPEKICKLFSLLNRNETQCVFCFFTGTFNRGLAVSYMINFVEAADEIPSLLIIGGSNSILLLDDKNSLMSQDIDVSCVQGQQDDDDELLLFRSKTNQLLLLKNSELEIYDDFMTWSTNEEHSTRTELKKKLSEFDEDVSNDDSLFNRYIVRCTPSYRANRFEKDEQPKINVNREKTTTLGILFIIDKLFGDFYVWKDNKAIDIQELKSINSDVANVLKENVKDFQYRGGVAVWLTIDGQIFYAFTENFETKLLEGNLDIKKAERDFGTVTIKTISVGYGHFLAISTEGMLYSFGHNLFGQTGVGKHDEFILQLSRVKGIQSQISKISAGSNFSLVLTVHNDLYTFGSNHIGQLGFSPSISKHLFEPIRLQNKLFGEEKILSIDTGDSHSIVRTISGSVYSWGNNNNHQLLRSNISTNFPLPISSQFVQALKLNDSSIRNIYTFKDYTVLHRVSTANDIRHIELEDGGKIKFATLQLNNQKPTIFQSIEEIYIETNQNILTNFELVEEIGHGAEGILHKYIQKVDNQTVAIKHLKITKAEIGEFFKHFSQIKSLSHIHLTPYLDGFCNSETDDETFCHIVMPYYDTLTSLIFYHEEVEEDESLPDAFKIAYQIADAIEYLHQLNLVHRDIKVENILLDPSCISKCVKIADFGYLQSTREEDAIKLTRDSPDFQMRRHAIYLGSLPTISPELKSKAEMSRENLRATDCFSFGVLLYNLMTLHTKIKLESNSYFMSDAILKNDQATYSNIRTELTEKGFDKTAVDLVLSLLKKNWADRPTMKYTKCVLQSLNNNGKNSILDCL